MTPSQVRDRNPDWKALTGIAGAVAAASTALSLMGFTVLNPRERIEAYVTQQAQVVQRLDAQITAQSRRIDSLSVVVDQVNALVQVKCIETNNRLIRQMLECRP